MSQIKGSKGIAFYGRDFFVIKEDEDLVSESIARLVMTNWSERVGMLQFGGNLKSSLFEQLDADALGQIESNLRDIIDLYEPRAIVRVLTVTPDTDNSTVAISIGFNYIGKPDGDVRFIELDIKLD